MFTIKNNTIYITDLRDFNIQHILECGQVFRFKKVGFGYEVYSLYHKAVINCQKSVKIECDDANYFVKYFDLQNNYGIIKHTLEQNSLLKEAIKYGYGIRILKQDPLETIISFIISANNNIPRIKNIIENICAHYGKNMGDYYAFPTLEELKLIPLDFFRKIGCGYRSEYLFETIKMIGESFDLEKVNTLSTVEAEKYLCTLKGVGPKVANCILLFGYGKTDVFPTDTWIKKVYAENFNGKSKNANVIKQFFIDMFGNLSGFAQQYLFYSKRERNLQGDMKWKIKKLHY